MTVILTAWPVQKELLFRAIAKAKSGGASRDNENRLVKEWQLREETVARNGQSKWNDE